MSEHCDIALASACIASHVSKTFPLYAVAPAHGTSIQCFIPRAGPL